MQFRPTRPAYAQNTAPAEKVPTKIVMPTLQSEAHQWLTNKLSSASSYSWLRFMPSFDEQGNELAFLMENADPANLSAALADAFWSIELMQLYKNNTLHKVVTNIANEDSKGNAVRFPKPRKDKSGKIHPAATPAGQVIQRFNWACKCNAKLVECGYDPIISPEMAALYATNVTGARDGGNRPQLLWLIQAIAYVLDGQSKKDENGEIIPTVGVFPFQSSAFDSLLNIISGMRNPTLPISQANLAPTNDIISCKGGHSVQYKAVWKPGEDGRDRPSYSLSPSEHQPFTNEQLSEIFVPWQKLLPDPTIEESVEMMIGFLGGEAIDYGLRSSTYEDYIPQGFRGSAEHIEPCMMSGDELRGLRPKAAAVQKPEGAPAPQRIPNTVPRPQFTPPVSSHPIQNFAPDTTVAAPVPVIVTGAPAPQRIPNTVPRPQFPPPVSSRPIQNFAPDTTVAAPVPVIVTGPPSPPVIVYTNSPLPAEPFQIPAEVIPSSAGAFADALKKSPLADRLKNLSKRV